MIRVVIRAFNKDGYYKDICIMSEERIRQADERCDESNMQTAMSGLFGVGVTIDPTKFSEMVRFSVVIVNK